jgi:hypothetical protein
MLVVIQFHRTVFYVVGIGYSDSGEIVLKMIIFECFCG